MLYDGDGNVISLAEPSIPELRKSYALTSRTDQYGEWPMFVHPSSLGRLPNSTLRDIYKLSSSVRPAVDSITREISTLPWKVIHEDMRYHPPAELADINAFLKRPNLDRKNLSTILSEFSHDYLVVGKGVMEKVRNPFGDLIELVARDSTLFTPRTDSKGFIINYIEYKVGTYSEIGSHRKENIIFRYYTPTTYTYGSCPVIETIINEVAVLMLSVKAIGWALTRDEIPPGVLVLGKIGEGALNRAKASFEATKGILGQSKIRVIDNMEEGANGVGWVQFTRPFREMQVAELMPMIERIVARNFGLSPVESSLADIPRQVADVSNKSSQSKLTLPLMTIIKDAIQEEVVEDVNPKGRFIWSRTPQVAFKDEVAAWSEAIAGGLVTDNEARIGLGLDPVQGGDGRSVKVGNQRVPLDEVTGLPKGGNPAQTPLAQPGAGALKSLGFSEEDFNEVFIND